MQELVKKHTTGFIVSLIASIFLINFLQPILEFTGSAIMSFGVNISADYVDIIYTQISHLEIGDFGFFFFIIFLSLMMGTSFSIVVIIWTIGTAKEISEKISNTDEIKPISITKKLLVTFLLIITSFFCITMIATRAYQLSLVSSFKQHLRIVAPFISTQEEEVILSDWSLIKNKQDYDLVYYKLEEVANQQGIKLPENKIYSLTSL